MKPRLPYTAEEGRGTGQDWAARPPDAAGPSLGQELSRYCAGQPDLSGVRLMRDGKDAFAARALLARSAERTLDVQYYIWHDDLSGSLMFDELEAAADRGVRVRLLLDDNGTARLDTRLACLNMHERMEVRLYNPFRIRRPKTINWLFDARRLNHRMHSKSFTADSQISILGGRNIGDEYFAARPNGLFADLDILAIGDVVPEVSKAFDRCWNSGFSRPLESLVPNPSARKRKKEARKAAALARSEKAEHYREAVRAQPLFRQLADGTMELTWAKVSLVEHAPEPLEGPAPGKLGLDALLPGELPRPETGLDLVSGYFVPTAAGAHELGDLARQGVSVRVLTNCYAATDVGFVHAGYAPYRRCLVEAGVALFEMPAPNDKPRTARKFVRPGSRLARAAREPGSTLHAKAFAVDRKQLYVGSANFDPRSACLNAELGLLIESEDLAGAMADLFDREIACTSYRLGVDSRGRLQWVDERDDDVEPEFVEPGTTWFSRMLVGLLARLPIERLL